MSPPWTNTWDETKPADTDLANTIGTQSRQLKLDVRQRLDWQHVWNQNVNDDGGHRFVLIASSYHPANTESWKSSGYSLTGAAANSVFDAAGTWNTSGVPTGFKLNILDTASDVTSLLMDLQIGGVSKFKVDKAGNVTAAGNIGSATSIQQATANTTFNLTLAYANVTQLLCAITPSTSSRRVLIRATVNVGIKGVGAVDLLITRGNGGPTVKEFIGVWYKNPSSDATVWQVNVPIECIDSPATTASTTYYIQAKYQGSPTSAHVNLQGPLTDNPKSIITLQEIV